MWPNPQFPADLVTFTKEILNGKLHFFCSEKSFTERIQIVWMKWLVNTKTYLHFLNYRKFWAYPFPILQSSSGKVLGLRQTFIDPCQNFINPHNSFSSCSFTRWIFRMHFEIHTKNNGNNNKVARRKKPIIFCLQYFW